MTTPNNFRVKNGLTVANGISVGTGISANGTYGSNGQVLTTNGSSVYWSGLNASNINAGLVSVGYGGTGLTSGTSGGILYYSGTNTLASSGALTANNFVVGGGDGAAPSTTSLLSIAAAVTTGSYVKATGFADAVVTLGNSGTAMNIDVTNGGVFTCTLTGNCTFTLRYPVASGSSSFTLILANDGTASRTIAWAGGSFKFPGGAASISRTTTANAIDVWVFFTPDGGTTWYGNVVMKDLKA